MATTAKDNVSYRLLNRLSNLVICARCLRSGVVTPVPQMISERHALTNHCVECRSETRTRPEFGQKLATLVTLRR